MSEPTNITAEDMEKAVFDRIAARLHEDARLGILVMNEFAQRKSMWRKKSGGYPDISFSCTLVSMAGGLIRLLTEWQEVDYNGKPVGLVITKAPE